MLRTETLHPLSADGWGFTEERNNFLWKFLKFPQSKWIPAGLVSNMGRQPVSPPPGSHRTSAWPCDSMCRLWTLFVLLFPLFHQVKPIFKKDLCRNLQHPGYTKVKLIKTYELSVTCNSNNSNSKLIFDLHSEGCQELTGRLHPHSLELNSFLSFSLFYSWTDFRAKLIWNFTLTTMKMSQTHFQQFRTVGLWGNLRSEISLWPDFLSLHHFHCCPKIAPFRNCTAQDEILFTSINCRRLKSYISKSRPSGNSTIPPRNSE